MSISSFYKAIQTLAKQLGYILIEFNMSKEKYKPDNRLKNVADKEDASSSKDADKLIKVKKEDTAEDQENDFVIHEKPADEQMHESFDDLRNDHMDEEAD